MLKNTYGEQAFAPQKSLNEFNDGAMPPFGTFRGWHLFMQKYAKQATIADILNGPLPKYRTTVIVPNGKHSPTYKTVLSHKPPTKKDVELKSAHNRQGMPTGC